MPFLKVCRWWRWMALWHTDTQHPCGTDTCGTAHRPPYEFLEGADIANDIWSDVAYGLAVQPLPRPTQRGTAAHDYWSGYRRLAACQQQHPLRPQAAWFLVAQLRPLPRRLRSGIPHRPLTAKRNGCTLLSLANWANQAKYN